MAEAEGQGRMKARGSTDPKVGKKNDDQDEDSHGQDEDHVEEDLATVAKLQEGQKEVLDHPQDEMGEVGDSRSEIGEDFHSDENPDHWVIKFLILYYELIQFRCG